MWLISLGYSGASFIATVARDLDRLEGAVVEVALELGQRAHDLGIADQEAPAPPAMEKDLVRV